MSDEPTKPRARKTPASTPDTTAGDANTADKSAETAVPASENSGTVRKPRVMPKGRPFVKNDPRRGCGVKGRSGRKPTAFKVFASEQVRDPEVQEKIAAVLRDPSHPAYGNVLKHALHYGEGMPTQSVEVKAEVAVKQTLKIGDSEIEF